MCLGLSHLKIDNESNFEIVANSSRACWPVHTQYLTSSHEATVRKTLLMLPTSEDDIYRSVYRTIGASVSLYHIDVHARLQYDESQPRFYLQIGQYRLTNISFMSNQSATRFYLLPASDFGNRTSVLIHHASSSSLALRTFGALRKPWPSPSNITSLTSPPFSLIDFSISTA